MPELIEQSFQPLQQIPPRVAATSKTNRFAALITAAVLFATGNLPAANPIITNVFTADPAPLVVGKMGYLYCGQDEAKSDRDGYRMNRWLCFSTKDMKTWKEEGSPLKPTDFKWATGAAWASQVIERRGKFYWYAASSTTKPITAKPSAWRCRTLRPAPSSMRADQPWSATT